MARPVTNAMFQEMLHAAGYGNAHAAFARQLNHAGRVHGTWRYDAASVYWWLRGRRPAEHVQATMAETFARKLARPVAVTELGFEATNVTVSASYPASASHAIDTAEKLWALLAKQLDSSPAGTFHSGDALRAALAWRYDRPDERVARSGRQLVTRADIQSLYALAEHFMNLDRRHGGGSPRTRAIMADFLVRQVAPMLRGTYTEAIGRDLMRATATLAGQLAFMFYDAGAHTSAQQHLTIALRLAKAADDRLYGAHLLANLATQAVYLGHTQDAARLAEAAIDGAGRAPAAVRARLYTTAASAYGRAGERRACETALTKAEQAIDRTDTGEIPRWATYFSPAHYAGTALKCLSDLRLPEQALRHAPVAIALTNQNARTLALHTALIAMTYARAGDIEAACHWGRELGRHLPDVRSVRVTHRIRELTTALNAYQAVPQVNALLETLRAPVPNE
ncbi:hypothetical protein [Micromonospora sp. KLBMP9576]|uniref:hypothetical protein n=1 Tax=Micromonospora sp. KLBMP9576 TaxID=3424769 RepID=UPI003D8FF538